jgi:hypothetical protein
MHSDFRRIISVFALALFILGVGIFAYLGIYNRYWADDWCYNADLHELGFVGTLNGYTYITTYASNRFALTFFSGIFYALGVLGVQLMTPLNILILCISLYWVAINVSRITNLSWEKSSLAIFSLITIYYSLNLAPHLYQSVYWRSGSLPYFEPLVLGVLLFALITYQATLDKPSPLLMVLSAVISFLAGGFSEAACATLVTALILFIVLTLVVRNQTWTRHSLLVAGIALLFALFAMALLILSPTSAHRVELYGETAGLLELPVLILRFSFDFIKYSLLDLPLPHAAMIATAALLGYLLHRSENQMWNARQLALISLVILMVTFLLIAASYAPSAYIERVPPHPRTRIIPRFALTIAILLISWLIGAYIRGMDRARRLYVLAVFLFAIGALYSIRSIWITGQKISLYADRAQMWDQRAKGIQEQIDSGLKNITIEPIDGAPVGGIRDFETKGQGKPGYWINKCAARYYEVEAIDVGDQ